MNLDFWFLFSQKFFLRLRYFFGGDHYHLLVVGWANLASQIEKKKVPSGKLT